MVSRATAVVSLAATVAAGCAILAAHQLPIQRQTSAAARVATYPVRFELPWRYHPGDAGSPATAIAAKIDETTPEVDPVAADRQSIAPPISAAGQRPDILPGLLAVKFDLAGSGTRAASTAGEQISVSMPVVYNDTLLGAVPIWIDPAGAISVDSGELSRVLSVPNKTLADAIEQSGQGRTSFASLRARGMTVHYDPIGNRIVIAKRT